MRTIVAARSRMGTRSMKATTVAPPRTNNSGSAGSRKRGRVEWDPVNLKPLNDPMLMHVVRPTFREGYEV